MIIGRSSSNLKAGENIFNVRTDLPENKRSNVLSTRTGNLFSVGNTGTINSKSKNLEKTVIHETLHFLGLSDRYDDFSKNHLYRGSSTVPHRGFENDIMGGGTMEDFNNIHYENIFDFARGFQGPMDESGKVEYNSNQMYDRRGTTLRNGNQQNSHYDERSDQAL